MIPGLLEKPVSQMTLSEVRKAKRANHELQRKAYLISELSAGTSMFAAIPGPTQAPIAASMAGTWFGAQSVKFIAAQQLYALEQRENYLKRQRCCPCACIIL